MITVVTGPPCSGKSYHVAENAKPDDIVIDLDRIALALAAPDTGHHDYPDHVRNIARRARIAAIDAAIPLGRSPKITVWIIDAAPSRQQRAWYHRRGATFTNMDAPAAVLAARVNDRPARNQQLIASLHHATRTP